MEFSPELSQKRSGAYFTPEAVAASLVAWAVHKEEDRLLDPSCGDGQFLVHHRNVVGLEQNPFSARVAMERAPWSLVHEGDFFSWASETNERFECAAGNPPFIRYQTFKGASRTRALEHCQQLGARFSGLTSAWAPFLAAAAALVKQRGRMAFVVPAEIGHAPYAAPLLEYLLGNFSSVHLIAVREKLFPRLSEDCWLLYAEGKGGAANSIRFTALDSFHYMPFPPAVDAYVSIDEWRYGWGCRLRPFLAPRLAREAYLRACENPANKRLSDFAHVGIGYVSGANDFFHLRPSEARKAGIDGKWLVPTLRNGRGVSNGVLARGHVESWIKADEQMLLLRLPKDSELDSKVRQYLKGEKAVEAMNGYKCRTRTPWYSVPDVRIPDFFLSYMCGESPFLARNDAGITCTNSVHAVRVKDHRAANDALAAWGSDMTKLSCELEGHPLGGGMLKLEPREASAVLFAMEGKTAAASELVREAVFEMRRWRHQ